MSIEISCENALTSREVCDRIMSGSDRFGEMSEWFKEPVLKTGDAAMRRGFESHSLRQFSGPYRTVCSTCGSTQEAEGAPLLRE